MKNNNSKVYVILGISAKPFKSSHKIIAVLRSDEELARAISELLSYVDELPMNEEEKLFMRQKFSIPITKKQELLAKGKEISGIFGSSDLMKYDILEVYDFSLSPKNSRPLEILADGPISIDYTN